MDTIKVLLVEDDFIFQKAMSKYLNQEEDMIVIGTATSKEEALKLSQSLDIDIILMDLNLSGNNFDGIEAAIEISKSGKAKIIILTSVKSNEVVTSSFTAGAVNFIRKEDYKELPKAIRAAYHDTSPLEVLLKDYTRLKKEEQLKDLSGAEREVYDLLEKGLSRTQVEENLYKSENTIKQYIKQILRKLGAKNTREAVEKVNRKGLM